MKKLILLLIACLSFALVNAQSAKAVELPSEAYYTNFTGLAAVDTSSVGGAWYKEFMPNKGERLFYDFRVKVTEVSATTSATIVLAGKKMDTDTYVTITTQPYKGTGADTTISFTEASTASFYRFFRVTVTPANGKLKTAFIKAAFKK